MTAPEDRVSAPIIPPPAATTDTGGIGTLGARHAPTRPLATWPRLAQWETRLAACLQHWQTQRFAWAGADCVAFAVDAIRAVTDQDLRDEVPWYVCARDALHVLRQMPFDHRLAVVLGPPVSTASLRRGDLVWDPAAASPGLIPGALGVCLGEQTAWRDPVSGLVEAPTIDAAGGWHVG